MRQRKDGRDLREAEIVFTLTKRSAQLCLVGFAALLLICLFASRPANAEIREAVPVGSAGADVERTSDSLTYFIDTGERFAPEEVWSDNAETSFVPITKSEPNFGFQKDPIWLRLPIENESDAPVDRVLLLKTNFVTEIDVWLTRDGGGEQLLSQQLDSAFATRPIAFHQLAAPFALEPGENAEIFIRYRTTGLTAMPVEIHTDLGFATHAAGEMAGNFAFYGVMMMLLLASLCAFVITRTTIFLWYGGYASCVTFYIFHRDGYAFQFFWPEFGAWNSIASMPLAAALTIFAAQFTRVYLDTVERMRFLDKVLAAVIALHLVALISGLFFDIELIKQLMTLSIPLSAMIFLASGLAALRRKGVSAIAFVLGWLGIVAASIVTFVAHWLDIEVTRAATLDTMRTAMVFDAIMMGLACVSVITQWRRERESLMRERLDSAERNMQLRTRLAVIEQNNQIAEEMLDKSSRFVADTTHDLRQPIFTLRSAILNLSTKPNHSEADLESIEASLDYMESLVEQNLDQATEAAPIASPESEPVPAQRLLDAVSAIFREEAEASGIDLRIVPSSATIDGDTADILRMLCNLISNAITYSEATKILVAARSRKNGLRFDVIDNGCGIAPELAGRLKQRAVRGESADQTQPKGKGLGLAIVQELADKLGARFDVAGREGRGSRFSITLGEHKPVAALL